MISRVNSRVNACWSGADISDHRTENVEANRRPSHSYPAQTEHLFQRQGPDLPARVKAEDVTAGETALIGALLAAVALCLVCMGVVL